MDEGNQHQASARPCRLNMYAGWTQRASAIVYSFENKKTGSIDLRFLDAVHQMRITYKIFTEQNLHSCLFISTNKELFQLSVGLLLHEP